jgi:small GTP-binding protein
MQAMYYLIFSVYNKIMWDNYNYLYKCVIVGDSSVGKSQFISKLCQNKFNQNSKQTIGVEFATQNIQVDDKIIKLQIWDTSGESRYRALTSAYYRGSTLQLLFFDLSNIKSFNNLEKWINEIKEFNNNPFVVLIGNKSDLEKRINQEQINEFAITHCDGRYYEISCKSDDKVKINNIVYDITKTTFENNQNNIYVNEFNENQTNTIENNKDNFQTDDCTFNTKVKQELKLLTKEIQKCTNKKIYLISTKLQFSIFLNIVFVIIIAFFIQNAFCA